MMSIESYKYKEEHERCLHEHLAHLSIQTSNNGARFSAVGCVHLVWCEDEFKLNDFTATHSNRNALVLNG